MSENFCNRDGIRCPYKNTEQQKHYCASWDPRDFLCNDTCRHLRIVESIETAAKNRLARIEEMKKKPEKKQQAAARPDLAKAETPEQDPSKRKEEITKERTKALQQISAQLAKLYEAVREVADILKDQEGKR